MIKRKSKHLKRPKKTQKIFLMKGCSDKCSSHKFRKTITGGRTPDMTNSKTNINFDVYPNKGIPTKMFNFINPQISQVGGNKKTVKNMKMKGGKELMQNENGVNPNYSNNTSIAKWFGDSNTTNYQNFIPYNNFKNSLTTSIINTGANRPFLGGKKIRIKTQKHKNKKSQRGGSFSNSLTQDLVNLGRQIQYGFGSAYNSINGYNQTVNPLPWKQNQHFSNNVYNR